MNGKIVELSAKEAIDFILPRHYAGRKPQVSVAFGWIIDEKLVAVCTFGKPASRTLCTGICGEQYSNCVYELNRLCRIEELRYQLSEFVSGCLRHLMERNWIIVSYSDTGMHHNGYIYQACNFMYTGRTKARTDEFVPGRAHHRHARKEAEERFRVLRTAKNRYVYFATHSKRLKKVWLAALNYPILPYPKEQNQNYVLGQYQNPVVIDKKTGAIVDDICFKNVKNYCKETMGETS